MYNPIIQSPRETEWKHKELNSDSRSPNWDQCPSDFKSTKQINREIKRVGLCVKTRRLWIKHISNESWSEVWPQPFEGNKKRSNRVFYFDYVIFPAVECFAFIFISQHEMFYDARRDDETSMYSGVQFRIFVSTNFSRRIYYSLLSFSFPFFLQFFLLTFFLSSLRVT